MDDCLSALDAYVKEKIFNKVIKKLLSKKTIILVTHSLYLMPKMDKIIVFKEGKIVETGTYYDLHKNLNSEFNKISV